MLLGGLKSVELTLQLDLKKKTEIKELATAV